MAIDQSEPPPDWQWHEGFQDSVGRSLLRREIDLAVHDPRWRNSITTIPETTALKKAWEHARKQSAPFVCEKKMEIIAVLMKHLGGYVENFEASKLPIYKNKADALSNLIEEISPELIDTFEKLLEV